VSPPPAPVVSCMARLTARCRWVHYFLHTGHLHIEGRKMSKSLKNFLTIRFYPNHYNQIPVSHLLGRCWTK
jgi:cysteinyl-tRNA synthetase